jgi:hypothetical protein
VGGDRGPLLLGDAERLRDCRLAVEGVVGKGGRDVRRAGHEVALEVAKDPGLKEAVRNPHATTRKEGGNIFRIGYIRGEL